MGDKTVTGENRIWKFAFVMVLMGICVFTTLKVLFFGTDIDEQYAVAMAYRMVKGDRMFAEMWEPHQTSGFLAALLIGAFHALTGSYRHLFLFLRGCSCLIQGGISIFLFRVLKRNLSAGTAFATAVFFYNILPKYNQSVDFSNMFLWFSTLFFLCLLMSFETQRRAAYLWTMAAAVCLALLVLSYPTTVLVIFPVLLGIIRCSSSKTEAFRRCAALIMTDVSCAAIFLLYFMTKLSCAGFLSGLQRMMSDSSHSDPLLRKLSGYGGDMKRLLPYFLMCLAVSAVLWFVLDRICGIRDAAFGEILLLVCVLQQMYVWIFASEHIKFPGIFWMVLIAIGFVRYFGLLRGGDTPGRKFYDSLFWFGSVSSLFLLAAALYASNMRLNESSEYMAVGALAAFCYFDGGKEKIRGFCVLSLLAVLGAAAFRKGYFLYYFWGKDTLFVTKQKVLDGPLEDIYCRWSDGTEINEKNAALRQYVPDGSKVLYIGVDNVFYLTGEYEVCNFSTISTPALDGQLFEYWDAFPHKAPEYIVWNKAVPSASRPDEPVKERLLKDAGLIYEDANLLIYTVPVR